VVDLEHSRQILARLAAKAGLAEANSPRRQLADTPQGLRQLAAAAARATPRSASGGKTRARAPISDSESESDVSGDDIDEDEDESQSLPANSFFEARVRAEARSFAEHMEAKLSALDGDGDGGGAASKTSSRETTTSKSTYATPPKSGGGSSRSLR